MTKTFNLQQQDNHYELFKVPMICMEFVNRFVKDSEKITVTISTEPLPESQRVFVCKGGFYRWGWNIPETQESSGMFPLAEDLLCRVFPDALENGLDQPKPLWIQIQKNRG